jgi:hypothetical protein
MDEKPERKDPLVSVGTFLSEALEYHAEDQIFQELGGRVADLVKEVARRYLDGQTQVFVQRSSEAESWLDDKEKLLGNPWLRYGIELELAYRALERVHVASERYLKLDYGSLSSPLSEKAIRYVAQVVATYAFGFEPASMALCRACLEQILKDSFVARKIYRRTYLDRNDFGATWYLKEAKKNRLLSERGLEAGERIVRKGNQIMHKFMHEERIQTQLARDSIKDLIAVVLDLERSSSEDIS